MSRITRALAAVLLLTLSLALPEPAAAATPVVTTHLGQLTLAPGGIEKQTLLWLRIVTDAEATHHFAVSIDYSGVASFATVDLALAFSASAAAARATGATSGATEIESSPATGDGVCQHGDTTITCGWDWYLPALDLTMPIGVVTANPASAAADGDSGTVTVTSKLDESAEATGTSTVRVGTAVDLAADTGGEVGPAPGKTAQIAPAVTNAGTTAVDGAALVIAGSSALLGKTSYRNCRYGEDLVLCTFDTSVAAGATDTVAQSFTVIPPADSVPGSVGEFATEWLTAAEYDDFVDIFPDDTSKYLGTPGTGAALALTASAAAAGSPQSDVNSKNDSSTYVLTVAGGGTPDLAAIGAKQRVAMGSSLALRVGMLNRGPGTLHPELYANNALTTEVRVPENVMVADLDTRCGESGYEGYSYTCTLGDTLAVGDRAVFDFDVQLESRHGAAGAVDVTDALADTSGSTSTVGARAVNSANNTAKIVVTATGSAASLPITGPQVIRTATAGLALIVIGLLLTVRRGGRPIGAHARGNRGRRGRHEGSAR